MVHMYKHTGGDFGIMMERLIELQARQNGWKHCRSNLRMDKMLIRSNTVHTYRPMVGTKAGLQEDKSAELQVRQNGWKRCRSN